MKRNRNLVDKSFIFLGLIIAVFAIMSVVISNNVKTDRITNSIKNNETISFLLIVNKDQKILFSEVFLYDTETHKMGIIDIPPNVGSIIDEFNKIERIDILYSKAHVKRYKEKVDDIINKKTNFFIELDLDNISNLTDLCEGVEVFLANPIEQYEDEIILLPAGSLHLDGSKVKEYLEYNNFTENEVDSVSQNQKILLNLIKKLGENDQLFNQGKAVSVLNREINTDLTKKALVSFLKEISKTDLERVIYQKVLGVSRLVDGSELLFPHYNGKLLKETVKQIIDSLSNSEILSDENIKFNIEILNGTLLNGLAGRTSQVFRSFGYEISSIRNADTSDYEKTVVISYTEDVSIAQRVANIIKCTNIKNEFVDNQLNSDEVFKPKLDVSIILGKDFDGRYCKN